MERQELITHLKQLPMVDYLAHRGYQPDSRSGRRWRYFSPFRSETTPSFWVDEQINRYKDHGDPEKGDDLIRLVMRLDGCSFNDALETLLRYDGTADKPDFLFIGPTPTQSTATSEVRSIKLLENPALVRYVESRKISYPIARRYLKEVYYAHRDKNMFALGFANDRDGYALRSIYTKRNIGPAAITTIAIAGSTAVNVFEGFFDFLTALEYYRLTAPRCTTIVLNSTANLHQARPLLQMAHQVNTYLDNDRAGRQATDQMLTDGVPVIDRSSLYADYNDLNEFWMGQLVPML